jgi:RNA polymerase sigma-70 factor (ECF subfamily)
MPITEKNKPTDAELVLAGRRGDEAGLGILLERYRPRLYAVALSLLGYGPRAEDAVHDTFLIALQKIGQLREPAAVGGWLHAVLRNVCRMSLRVQPDEIPLEEIPAEAEPFTDLGALEGRMDETALRDWIWTALSALPETLRVTAMLRYFGSYAAYDEIAKILGIPVGTVRSRLSQVKLKLSDALLKTAGLDLGNERVRQESQARSIQESWEKLYQQGERETFLADYSRNLVMHYSDGETLCGITHLEKEINGDLETGTRVIVQRVLSCRTVSILEGQILNPPENPFRCPPGMTLVFHHNGRRIERVRLYFAPRPPKPEE